MAQPEHNLQTKIVGFVRDCVAVDHEFWANDRSRKHSALQHVREKNRGLRPGVSDTTLAVVGLPEIYIELKWPPNKPDDNQKKFGAAMQRLGRFWAWADSVHEFRLCLEAAGVPLRPNAAIVAAHLDALLAGAAARKAGKVPRSYRKPRGGAPSGAALRFGRAHEALGRKG